VALLPLVREQRADQRFSNLLHEKEVVLLVNQPESAKIDKVVSLAQLNQQGHSQVNMSCEEAILSLGRE